MKKGVEYIFLLSVCFLQVSSFLPSSDSSVLLMSGDNLIMTVGILSVVYLNFFRRSELSTAAKYAFIAGVIFTFIIPLYRYLKEIFLIGTEMEYSIGIFKTTIRIILVFFFIKYISINYQKYERGLNAILLFGIVITLSMLFEQTFRDLGFHVRIFGESEEKGLRYAGFTGLNVNALGALLCTLLGIAMSLFSNKIISLWQFIIYASSYIIGILLTGSRNSAIVIVFLFTLLQIDSFSTFRLKLLLPNLIIILIAYYLFIYFGENTLSRFDQNSTEQYGGIGRRVNYWILYSKDIVQNPVYLLIGNLESPTYSRSAHNYYIQTIFYTGIFFISAGFLYLFKAIKMAKQLRRNYNLISIDYKYILIPIIVGWLTNADKLSWYGFIGIACVGVFTYNPKILGNRDHFSVIPGKNHTTNLIA